MKQNKDFKTLANSIMQEVGGAENISHVAHCATRLRFNLKNDNIPNDERIKSLKGVIGVTRVGGQLQIIIGPTVNQLFEEVNSLYNIHANIEQTVEVTEKKKVSLKSIGNGILDALSGSLTPAIPVITIAAFFKMIAAICGPNMLNVMSESSDLFVLLSFVGDAGFYFFPVIIGYTASRKFKVNPLFGILLGCIMIHPQFMALLETGSSFSVYGIPASVENYSNTLLPIIMSVWVMSYVEKFFFTYVPEALKSILAPALTIAVMLPITLCVLGPIGAFIGTAMCNAILNMEGVFGFLGVAIIGATFSFLILTGMHIILITALIQAFMMNGHENFVAPGFAAATFAVAGICLGAALRLKDKEERSLSFSYLVSVLVAGVTEPGLYGVGIRYKKPLIGLMVGGFVGGLYFGILGIGHYTLIPVTNIISLLCFMGDTTANFVHGIIGCALSMGVAAAVTYFYGFPKEEKLSKPKEAVKLKKAI